ncbi:glycosyltransferase, partial [bacterium]|nr:glycosyltransferase [bacterium]
MFSLLGVKIDNLSLKEVLKRVEDFMKSEKQHYIVTVNPEFLVLAQKDKEFKKILNQADLSVPDGIGIVFASLLKRNNLIKSRVTGVDLFEKICYLASIK